MTDIRVAPVPAARSGPSRAYCWIMVVAMSIACYGSYYAFDYIGPLAPLLSHQLHFSDSQIGLLQAIYHFPNIVTMLVFGIVIDRIGTKKSMLIFGLMVFVGLVVTALGPQFSTMAIGRFIVGTGAEALAITTNVAIAHWFLHGELSLATGVRGSVMRFGSLSAQTSPTWARGAYISWQWPMLIAVGFGMFTVVGVILYWILASRAERRYAVEVVEPKDEVVSRGFAGFDRSFWLLAALCVTVYACFFPFQTFGQKLMIDTRHVTPQAASLLVGMLPFFSLIGKPFFGYLVDRIGKRCLFMTAGSLLIVPVFLMLGYTDIPPAVGMTMIGISFGLVPTVLWPAIVYVVPKSRLGFANGLMDAIQQAGLAGVNVMIGWSNDHWLASGANPAGYRPGMWIFTSLAVLAVLFSLILRRVETGPRAHGLETITAQH
jgi:MFS family permease